MVVAFSTARTWLQEYIETAFSRDSVGSRHVPHHRTSSFDDHRDYSFVVFKNVQLGFARGIMVVCGHIIKI